MTITEALAEIKTVEKRIAAKREFVKTYLARSEGLKDPLEKDGGSAKAITEAQQSIWDLETRLVELRRLIQSANEKTAISLEGETRSIADWLVWRREIAPGRKQFLNSLSSSISNLRSNAMSRGFNMVGVNQVNSDVKPTDIIVNIAEGELSKEIEALQNILGQLDGQLSLKNATVMVA